MFILSGGMEIPTPENNDYIHKNSEKVKRFILTLSLYFGSSVSRGKYNYLIEKYFYIRLKTVFMYHINS